MSTTTTTKPSTTVKPTTIIEPTTIIKPTTIVEPTTTIIIPTATIINPLSQYSPSSPNKPHSLNSNYSTAIYLSSSLIPRANDTATHHINSYWDPTPTRPMRIPYNRSFTPCIFSCCSFSFKNTLPYLPHPPKAPVHHRKDNVKDYCAEGARGWDGFRRQRVEDGEKEIGRVDWTWVGKGGRVVEREEVSWVSLGFDVVERGVWCQREGEEQEEQEDEVEVVVVEEKEDDNDKEKNKDKDKEEEEMMKMIDEYLETRVFFR